MYVKQKPTVTKKKKTQYTASHVLKEGADIVKVNKWDTENAC